MLPSVLSFTRALVAVRLDEVDGVLASVEGHHGSSHLKLFRRFASVTRSRLDELLKAPLKDAEFAANHRELRRLLTELDLLHELVSTYLDDLGAAHPVGLLQLAHSAVHDLVEVPLALRAEVLVHIDPTRNYALDSLLDVLATNLNSGNRLAGLDPTLGDSRDLALPVVLSLPAFDPYNAFLAPILAHEVAHVTSDQKLLGEFLDSLHRPLSEQIDALESSLSGPQTRSGKTTETRLIRWIDEIICDSLAAYSTGPAWVFAAAAFLPVPGSEGTDDHPPVNVRMRWALRALERWGWGPLMGARFGGFVEFLQDATASRESPSPAVQVIEGCFDTVMGVIETSQAPQMVPADYERTEKAHELVDAFALGYMPPNLATYPPDPWALLLAAWSAAVARSSDPDVVPRTVGDPELNRFMIKAFELAGISSLWAES